MRSSGHWDSLAVNPIWKLTLLSSSVPIPRNCCYGTSVSRTSSKRRLVMRGVHPDIVFTSAIGNYYCRSFTNKQLKKILVDNDLPALSVHALRHPYVKHTTKIYSCKSRNPKLPTPVDSLGFLFSHPILQPCR